MSRWRTLLYCLTALASGVPEDEIVRAYRAGEPSPRRARRRKPPPGDWGPS